MNSVALFSSTCKRLFQFPDTLEDRITLLCVPVLLLFLVAFFKLSREENVVPTSAYKATNSAKPCGMGMAERWAIMEALLDNLASGKGHLLQADPLWLQERVPMSM